MNLKSLLLGSAAALAASSGALAADLPVAEPVEYVRICDAFGTGYYFLPGTETCIALGGYIRYQAAVVNGLDENDVFGRDAAGNVIFTLPNSTNLDTRELNQFVTLGRGELDVRTATQTDLGVLRTVLEVEFTVAPGTQFDDNYTSTATDVTNAYISLSGDNGIFYAGRLESFYDEGTNGSFSISPFGLGNDGQDADTNLLGYVFAFGNGFSAGISMEDAASAGKRVAIGPANTTGPTPIVADDGLYGGQYAPDIAAKLKYEGGFGYVRLGGVLHHMRPNADMNGAFQPVNDFGLVESDFGYAVSLGAELKVPNTNISAILFAAYGDGAIGYVTGGNGFARTDGTVQRFVRADGTVGFVDEIETSEAFKIQGGVKVGLTDSFSVAVNAFYTHIDLLDDSLAFTAAAPVGTVFTPQCSGQTGLGLGAATIFTGCVADESNAYGAAVRADYTVASGLVVSAEVGYEQVELEDDQRFFGSATAGQFDGEADRWGAALRINKAY